MDRYSFPESFFNSSSSSSSSPGVYAACENTTLPFMMMKVCGTLLTFIARLKSWLMSSNTSYCQLRDLMNGATFCALRESSIDTAMSFAPYFVFHSSKRPWYVWSSWIHGLHHVAQKLTITGPVCWVISAVLTMSPVTDLIFTVGIVVDGVASCPTRVTNAKQRRATNAKRCRVTRCSVGVLGL